MIDETEDGRTHFGMTLTDKEKMILGDAFKEFRDTGTFPATNSFRVKHETDRECIDRLTKLDLLRNDSEKIQITVSGIFRLGTPEAKDLLDRCERLFPVLKEAYRKEPDLDWSTQKLSELAKRDESDVGTALFFLRDFSFWTGLSQDLPSGRVAALRLKEEVLDLTSLESAILAREMVINTSPQPTQKPVDETPIEPFDFARIQNLFTQLESADWQTMGGIAGQLFSELDRTARHSDWYKRFELERQNKWKDWPGPGGSFGTRWSLPKDFNDSMSLAYDIFRTCAESNDGGVGLAFELFRETKFQHGISKLKNAFTRPFANALEAIAREAAPKKEKKRTNGSRPVALEICSLHPEVQRIAGKLVGDGHYRQAIMDTFILVDNYVKEKSGVNDHGTSLMNSVFSPKNPVLELSDDKEEQTGFMMLFTGAIKAVRNQYAHSLVDPKTKEEALEWLGFASALLRLVDSAKRN